MMRTAALCASLLILTACAKPSPAPVEPPGAVPPDPRVCAELLKEPPTVGSIVAPVTPAEIAATREHLTSDQEARAWGRQGWDIVAVARRACPR